MADVMTRPPEPIEFVDLGAQRRHIGARMDEAIRRVIDHGRFILGPEVAELERQLAEFCGAKHVLSCANGTDALGLALMAKHAGPGQAVLVPSFTFAANRMSGLPCVPPPIPSANSPASHRSNWNSTRGAFAVRAKGFTILELKSELPVTLATLRAHPAASPLVTALLHALVKPRLMVPAGTIARVSATHARRRGELSGAC